VARPPLSIGTAGEFWYEQMEGGWRVRCRFRDYDGITRRVERWARTKNQAKEKLKSALRDRAYADSSALVTAETLVAELAEIWWAEFSASGPAANTLRLYRGRLDNQVLPALGALRLREVSVSRCDRLFKTVTANNGPNIARATRAVVSGLLGLATRHDAIAQNPTREVAAIKVKSKPTRALTWDELRDLRQRIADDLVARRRDLPDLVDLMIATGLRVGEAIAVVADAVDLGAGTVEVRGTVVREKGKGLYIQPEPKTEAGYRTLVLPSWAVTMLRRRMAGLAPDAPVFKAPKGGLRDPSNTSADLRQAFDAAGYSWATSHVFRKTVATMMDKAGLSPRDGADQLGHERVSMTQDNYWGREVLATGAARVMERVVESA